MTNEKVLRRAGVKRTVLKVIRKRQLAFLGHVMHKEQLENLSITGKFNGKRSIGRQRKTYMSKISDWTGKSTQEIIKTTKDRKPWKSMIVNVLTGHDT